MPSKAPAEPPARILILSPAPVLDAGRYAPKRTVGDTVEVSADVLRDGHDFLRAAVRSRAPGSDAWQEGPMRAVDAAVAGVRWQGSFAVDRQGRWEFDVEAWTDVFGTWRDELRRKLEAGQVDLPGEILEGAVLLEQAAGRMPEGEDREVVEQALATLRDTGIPAGVKHAAALDPRLQAAMEHDPHRQGAARLERPLAIEVDRVRGSFGSWYELFPRSWGGLAGVEKVLPEIAELGFDVLYLPPIHPIGSKNRKGRNTPEFPGGNPEAGPDEPGSPWAIGGPEGGHDAVHPELGTHDDLRRLTARARELGMDIALDFAIQCSADHPWLTEHPEWFHHRPDGSLKYAENPPKRYQDIYNVNWDSPNWQELWQELRRIVLLWVDCGVKAFRVDNPHTKPFPFWEWLISEVHAVDRDVVFFAEAFTKRSVMRELGKLGFTQSYTYFTWKNTRWELTEYVTELAYSGEQEYFRPNFFANTPDILHEYLQHGGPPAFTTRLVLAATLSPSYGIYSGYESFENLAVRPGSEEYMDSEKYVIRERRLDGPLLPLVKRLNGIRRENPALQRLSNVTFLDTHNDALIAYAKREGSNTVLVVVNLDPHNAQEGSVLVPAHLGVPPVFRVRDLILDEEHDWHIGHNFVRLWPPTQQAHVLRVETA
jgi:starch synthase (maltosyl-transferring)